MVPSGLFMLMRLTYRLPSGPKARSDGALPVLMLTNAPMKAPGDRPAGPWYSRIWPRVPESRLHTYRLPSDPKVMPGEVFSPPAPAATNTAPAWPGAGNGAPVDPS